MQQKYATLPLGLIIRKSITFIFIELLAFPGSDNFSMHVLDSLIHFFCLHYYTRVFVHVNCSRHFTKWLTKFFCHVQGCTHVTSSFQDYFVDRGKVIFSLVQAVDVYLLGTVMLVFGMGLYELFISNLDKAKLISEGPETQRSNLFGLFTLKERPRWLEIKTVNELKTKLGHVIVMLLLIGLFEKSKKAVIQSPLDLLCFSASVLLSSGCLFLLSKLNEGR
ncbi:uncharacterized protein LOC111391013 [Olea europaea var. sylvestris]|uniref:uncharacterized protein LOC111391013 n=1 Tax=Olea europaea var. sylvestris TaxID=158386 RepID=UPI000C1D04AA|nr:uncharacterized protein LOC111391013 [Olea europaea var. sylvestris]